ncbi:malonyl CoA-acyl carrier protein transacylase [Corallococcus coralloides]|uniref:Malonyl CoA-acyl carrier protein transacylase n=1 Tax=Corallococcus coralloides TaxID=184914 RepID=A0A410RQ99_CORCK|nr:type I polyketide synthase [Corallococcus coralloides]QAT84046.1 malonyl CoA-acyl carrier protein transacylase [Corallococcus coralloides]
MTFDSTRDVAIIGLSARLPGGPDLDAFWRNLLEGRHAIRTFTRDELLADGVPEALASREDYVPRSAFVEDTHLFDASFFGFSRREAEVMDPQFRLFFECAWEALEDAGHAGRAAGMRVGVFATSGMSLYSGKTMNTYFRTNVQHQAEALEHLDQIQIKVLNERDYLPTQLSYRLNLTGPSLTVHTACSSALVALHFGVESLRKRECDAALVGAAALHAPRMAGYVHTTGSIFSAHGVCRPFDQKADGIVGGNGVGVLMLRRLSDAQADGDRILAVIRGTAINNDGARKVSYTAPSIDGQKETIRGALSDAGISAREIGFVEAHGTGTGLGDPIEVAALTQAFSVDQATAPGSVAIGSVKSNVGHLDTAAGMASLLKTVLALRHGQVPPTAGYERPNSHIAFDQTPFLVNTQPLHWEPRNGRRHALIGSLGAGGTNAHVVLADWPVEAQPAEQASTDEPVCIALSAKNDAALKDLAQRHASALASGSACPRDWAYSTCTGRALFRERGAVVGRTSQQLAQGLLDLASGRLSSSVLRGSAPSSGRPRIAFALSGQGAQYAGMGRALYQRFASFRSAFDELAALHRDSSAGQSLTSLVFDSPDAALRDTGLAQPSLFAFQYALCRLWLSLGVSPSALIGHSIGEYLAAHLAGVLSLHDAYLLVLARSRAMASLPPGGAMLSVLASPSRLSPFLSSFPSLELAADNGPEACVLSGPLPDIERLLPLLESADLSCRPLHVSHAFHSAAMLPAMAALSSAASHLPHHSPSLPLASNLTGALATPSLFVPDYWARHLRQPVLFRQGLEALVAKKFTHFLEIGPRPVLTGLLRSSSKGLSCIPSLDSSDPERAFCSAAASLHALGLDLDWKGLFEGPSPKRISVPTYAFQRQAYWLPARPRQTETDSLAPVPSAPTEPAALTGLCHAPLWVPVEGKETAPRRWALAALGGAGPRLAELKTALTQDTTVTTELLVTPADAARLRADVAGIVLVQEELPVVSALSELRRWLLGLEEPMTAGRPIVLVTRGAHGTGAGVASASALTARALWGAARAASLEFAKVARLGLVDIGTTAAPSGLSAALATAAAGDELRLGQEGWLRQRLAPLPLPPVQAQALEEPGHAAIITGGFGGVGWQLAVHLVQRGVRELVLVGRSAPGAAVDATLAAWRRTGISVTVLLGDVAEPATWEALHREVTARGHRLGTLYHLAGVLKDATLANISEADLSRVLRPKVHAASALLDAVATLAPRRIVLAGSLAGVLGSPGQFAYAAANAALGVAAEHLVAAGIPTLALAWAPLDAGMAASTRRGGNVERIPRMALAQAWELMARALAAGLTELSAGALEQAGLTAHEFEVLSPGDLGRRLFVEKPAPAVEPQAVRPATVQDEPRATGALLQVQQTLAELLGERTADAIDPATNFQNLGLDSLMLIRLREQLNTRLRAKLTTATLYSYPTSRLLAEHITEQLRTKTEPASSNEGDAARSAEPPGLATAVAEPPAGPLGIEVMDDLAQAERLADELLRELGLR